MAISLAVPFAAGCQQVETGTSGNQPVPVQGTIDGSFGQVDVTEGHRTKLSTYELAESEPGGLRASMGAVLSGKLIVRQECPVIEIEPGSLVQPVFAYRSAVWDERKMQLTFRGQVYSANSPIVLSGGFVNDIERFKSEGGSHVADCGEMPLFAVST